ncbi:hypothetical protein HB999_07600 [Listeria booriae]|uniref:hypothetical protein n=1 Tax=Listeria booriae TaxID=1552123 RepID=UPI00164CFDD9|nr:hypothetical protein [Listeria booriae]MBC6163331.1 hypothetical protein [Listeria booriae]
MNKRIKKKCLADDEKKLLELYRAADRVVFYKHNLLPAEAKKFTKIPNGREAHFSQSEDTRWYQSGLKKIEVLGFIKKGVPHDEFE